MFLSPVEYGENKDISIQRNGTDLSFRQEFYGSDSTQGIDDWESVLSGIKSQSKPLGDGTGFWEYRIKSLETNEIYIRFLPESYYFRQSQGFRTLKKNRVELYNKNSMQDIILVSRQDFNPETNGSLIRTEIDDIYTYLYQKAINSAQNYNELRFITQQFNLYLYNFDVEHFDHNFFYLDYIKLYVGAIIYFVDFASNEELELTVSYVYQMGTSGYRHTANLHYYLSPAKYWKDFANIEINLTLSEKYKKLKSSSLSFKKIDDKNYKFTSASLPKTELKLTVSDGSAESTILKIAAIIGGLILIPIAIVVVVIIKRKKKDIAPINKLYNLSLKSKNH